MSNVELTQALTQVSATWADAVVTTLDIPRPVTTPAEPPYAEGTDHVTRPDRLREDEGGNVCIHIPTALMPANIFIRRISIQRMLPTPQKGISGPDGALFPSGASTDQEFVRDVLNMGTGNTLLLSDASVQDLLGVDTAAGMPRTYPGLTLMAGEFVRLEVYNNTGGPVGPATIEAIYRMGRSQSDTGRP